jgi:hypothetical protein
LSEDLIGFSEPAGERARAREKKESYLCADNLEDAFFDEAEQFGLNVVAGELERELMGTLTVTRLREDLVDGVLDGIRAGPASA